MRWHEARRRREVDRNRLGFFQALEFGGKRGAKFKMLAKENRPALYDRLFKTTPRKRCRPAARGRMRGW